MTRVDRMVCLGPEVEVVIDFDRFFEAQLRSLVGLAYVLSGSRTTAEDLAQDALFAAFRDWSRVGRMDDPGAWVRRVVANRAVSAVRRRVVELNSSARFRQRMDEPVSIGVMAADSEHVWAEVRKLPKRQAQVITLRTLDMSSVAEIAAVLGISPESASTHLRRARQTLARRLTQGDLQ